MSWWGKLIGGAFGYLLGGPLGVLLGAALGHQFDLGLKRRLRGPGAAGGPDLERTQAAFFTTVFSVMGHVAKADGRVSAQEIAHAERIMSEMRLNADQRRAAIRLFNEGKQPGFPLDDVVRQFREECHRRSTLLQMFIEIQLQAALADGELSPAVRRVLLRVGDGLGIDRASLERLIAMMEAATGRGAAGAGPRRTPGGDLAEAYRTLGVDTTASDEEVKRAYRRLMNQHHPDKLVAKGLPEEMVRLATERTRQVRNAYDRVRAARG